MFNLFNPLDSFIFTVIELPLPLRIILTVLIPPWTFVMSEKLRHRVMIRQKAEDERSKAWHWAWADWCEEWADALRYGRECIPPQILCMAQKHGWELGFYINSYRRFTRRGIDDSYWAEVYALYSAYYRASMEPYPKHGCPWRTQVSEPFPFVEE